MLLRSLGAPLLSRADACRPFLPTACPSHPQLPELKVYPFGFVSGEPIATRLQGHNVTVTYER
jgi:hypothetical protein